MTIPLLAFDQVFILLGVSIFFSLLYEVGEQMKRDFRWAGLISSIAWLTLGLVWFVLASTTYVVALLFNGLFIIYMVRVIIDSLRMRSLGRRLGDEI